MSENENEKNNGLTDIRSYFLRFLTFKRLPTDHVELSIVIFVGSMGSGKSTAINYMLYLLSQIYGDKFSAFRSDDLVSAIKSMEYNFVNALVIDDAIARSFDSRRSMSSENVIMSQSLSIARHIANKRAKAGILFIIFSVQDIMRLDAFIRRNADITIYKTYYKQLDKEGISKSHIDFVKDFTRRAMLEHEFSARAYALAIDRTGFVYRFHFPRVDLVPIEEIVVEEDPAESRKKIIREKVEDIDLLLDRLVNKKSYAQLEEKYGISHSSLHTRLSKLEKLWREE